MTKILSRTAIQRMVGVAGGNASAGGGTGAGGGAGADLTGYATEAWVNENYLSIEFFSSLFKAYDSAATPNEIEPNDGDTTAITNIKAMFGFWTEQYLSALGLNSAGGGGGVTLNEPLESINNSGLAAPGTNENGKTIVWNNSTGNWEYGSTGGGGSTALSGLSDVQLGTLSDGNVLAYDSTAGKWINNADFIKKTGNTSLSGTFSPSFNEGANLGSSSNRFDYVYATNGVFSSSLKLGGNDVATQYWVEQQGFITSETYTGTVTSVSITMPTGFSVNGSPVTSSGTLAVSFGGTITKNRVLASPYGSNGSPSWRALVAADIPDLSGTYLTSSALNGYATQQWVGQNYLGKNDTAAAATKLQTARSLWGNSFDGTADIGTSNSNATLNYVADINMSGNLTCQNVFADTEIRFHESGNWWWTLGYEAGISNSSFNLVRYNNSTYVTTVLLSADTNGGISVNSGQLWVKQSAQGIRIGDGVIQWDSTNNALKVIKSDGTAANLYTTGGVSALGMSAGVSQVDAMTFNHLSVKNSMTLNGSVNIIMGSSSQILRSSSDSDCIYLFNGYTNSKINSQKYYYNQYDNVGLLGKDYNYSDTTWWIDPDGCALFQRVYLSNNVYLYTDGSNIKVRIGSTVYTLTKS